MSLLGVSAVLLAYVPAGLAADRTWSGGGADDFWNSSGNWDVTPVGGDNAIFTGGTRVANSNDISGLSLGWVAINSIGSDFSLFGNALTLSSGITNQAGANSVNLPLTLGASQSFVSLSGSTLALTGGITNGGNTLTLTDAGDFLLGGVPAGPGVSGSGSLIKNGAGNLTVTNRQSLTGGIIVNEGTMTVTTPGNLNFGGALTPSLITVNTNGIVYGTTVHAIGGGTPMFINHGIWKLDGEDYKQSITMWDGSIEPGPTPNGSGGQLRVGFAGGSGSYTWYVTNSVAGSSISSPLSTIGSGVTLTLDVARGAAASDLTVSGVIQSSGHLVFARDGITTLSGANTQTGTTTINGGTVKLTGSLISSTITVASNAVFDVSGAGGFTLTTNQVLTGVGTVIGVVNDNDPGAAGSAIVPGTAGTAGTLIVDGLNLSGNSLALNFNLSSVTTVGGGVNDLIICTNLTLSGGATNTVNFAVSGTPAAGAYTLIQYPLGQGPAAGPVTTLAAAASRSTYTFSSDGTSIKVTIVANPAPLVWRGDGVTNSWDLNTSSNFINGASKDVFLTGDNATFNDTGSNTPAINLVGSLPANTVTVNSTKDYTFAGSGKITGSAKLVKTNSGSLTLTTGNDFTGGGLLNGPGVVNVGSGGATGAIGSGNLTNNTRVNFNLTASSTYAGSMSGTGSVYAFMPGVTLTLTGTNTFTGGLIVANGTTQIGNNTVGASPSVTGNITNYGTLNIYRSDVFTNKNNITSAGNTLEYGPGDINVRGVGGMTVDGSGSINTMPQGSLSVGQSAYGKLTVNAGGVITLGGGLFLGNPGSTSGDYIQNGGTVTANGNSTRVGHWSTEISTFTMNGGTFSAPNNQLGVGWDGIGLMYMNGGTVNVRTLNIDDNGATAAIGGTNSTLFMTNGTINIGSGGIGGNIAVIRLAGGTIAAVAPAGFSSGMAMNLTNAGPTFDTSNSIITLSGVLSGLGGLTKAGTGVLELNGINSYTNVTTVTAGRLQGSGVINGPVTVQSGAALSAGGTLARATLTISNNVTVNPGASIVIDQASTAASSDLIRVVGNMANDPAGTPLTINFTGGLPYTGGPNFIITNTGVRSGTLTYVNPTRYSVTLDQSNPNYVTTSFTGTNASLVWKGNVNNTWDVTNTLNWLNGASADKFYQSDAVLFDDSSLVTNVTLASAVTPASVTVNSAGNYKFSGAPITGLATLTKSGSGKLILENDYTSTGVITVGAGTLQIGNGGTLGSITGPNNLLSANIIDYASVVFNRSDTVAYSGVISGPGSLTQAGSGTLMVLGTQNHFGGTTINLGSTVQLGNGPLFDTGSLGSSPATNNGTLNFFRLGNIAVATPFTGNGAFNFLGTGGSGQSGYSLNATNTFTGPVTLSLARVQSGAGAQSFGSASSISVSAGSQVYAAATPASSIYTMPLTLAGTGWQDGLGALRIENGATWSGNITLANNARIGVNNASSNTVTGTITGAYELETYGGNASAILTLAPSSANTFNALRVSIGTAGSKTIAGNANAIPNNIPLTMNGGTLWLNGFSRSFSPFMNLSSSSSLQNGSASSAATVTLAPALGSSTYSGTFADGSSRPLNVTFTQTPGLWSLTLSGTSPNWTGNLTNNGGIITVGAANILGNQAAFGRNIVANNGATFVTTINNVLAGYNGSVSLNNSTWACNRYVSFNPGAGAISLVNSTITATNNTDGGGFLTMRLPSTVTVSGSSPSYLLATGTGAGYGLGNNAAGTTFDVANVTGNANADLIVTPLIYGSGSLIKTGPGTMQIESGFNNYTGSTIVSNGVLALGASAILVTTPNLIVLGNGKLDVSAVGSYTMSANQTIQGNGAIIGNVSDGSATTLSPGPAAGTLTFSNNLTLGGSGSVVFDLANTTTVGGGVNDLINVSGTLTIPNTGGVQPITFKFLSGAPAAGTYTLFQAGSISGDVTTLSNAVPSRYNAAFTQVGNDIRVTFSGGASNLVWGGDGVANDWDVNTSTNWFDGSASNVFLNLDTVLFDDSSANTTVNLGVTVQPGSVIVNSTNDYTITGAGGIAGSTGLTKNNTNTLTLATANTFTGPISVTQGVLRAGNNDTLPVQSAMTVASGAQFDYAGFGNNNTRGYSFNIAGSGPDGSGAINNTGGGIFGNSSVSNITLTADAVIGGVNRWDVGTGAANTMLNGNGFNLVKVGAFGTSLRVQTITNVASITVSNGNAWYENFNQTNAWTTTITNYIMPGTILGNYAGVTNNMPIVLDNATIRNEGGGSTPLWLGPVSLATSSLFNNSAVQNFYGIISGPGGINVNGGTAALVLSNANTFAGGTIISNAPVTTAAVDATAGSAAVIAAHPSAFGTGTLTISGLGHASLTTGTYFASNVLRAVEFAFAAPGTVSNNIVLPSTAITNVSLHGRDSAQSINLAGVISGGFTGMTNWIDFGDASAIGVMRYGNTANTFLGNISAFRGLLAITADGSLGSTANVLRLNNAGGLRFDGSGINVVRNISCTAATSLDVFGDNDGNSVTETGNSVTISGIISGSTAITVRCGTNLNPAISGTLALNGNNTFSGALTVSPFTKVTVGHLNGLGTTAAGTTVNNGGTLALNANGTYPSEGLTLNGAGVGGVGALQNLSGASILNGNIALGFPTTIGLTAGSLSLGGVISGSFPLTVVGTGTLTLNGANTYSAGTFVNGGTLLVNGLLPVGNVVTVSGTGSSVLGGIGTINGPVAINAGGALQPGNNAIGKLTVNASMSLAGTTTMEVSNTGSLSNDGVIGLVSVLYGGTLNVTNLGAQSDLTNGVKFTLFNSVVRLGSFSSVNLPPLDPGFTWNNNLAVDGSIEVVSGSVAPAPTTLTNVLSGSQLTLSWPAGQGWRLLSQTNARSVGLTTPTNTWYEYAPAASNTVTVSIEKTNPTVFFRLMYP